MFEDLPDLSRDSLVDLAGWAVLKEGRKLFESGSVLSVKWEKPVLSGNVRLGAQTFQPRLNLRSMTFAENRCSCIKGRKGYVCPHTVAICLEAERLRKLEVEKVASGQKKTVEKSKASVSEVTVKERKVNSLNLNEKGGKRLYLGILLPPNIELTAKRNAIMVKIEARYEGQQVTPENIFRGATYWLDPPFYKAVALIEEWCGGKMYGILSLKRSQLRELLRCLKGEQAVSWVNKPNEFLRWKEDKIPGVHEHLEEPVKQETVAVSKKRIPVGRKPSINVRRDSSVPRQRSSAVEDFKLRMKREGGAYVGKLQVDGSSNYIAITPPSRDDIHYNELLQFLRSNDFKNEPSNGRWWLRDRHKTLNFLALYQDTLKVKFGAHFTENFKQRTQGIRFAKFTCKTEDINGEFSVQMQLDAGSAPEQTIRRNLQTGCNYVINEDEVVLFAPDTVQKAQNAQRSLSGDPNRPFTVTFRKKLKSASLRDAEEILDPVVERLETPETWKARSGALSEIGQLHPAPIRKQLDDSLRSYQRIGVAWLWHLFRNDLGGLLADEMGLGKTIQALGLVSSVHSQQKGTTLVVCPASLVENWRREAMKWTPHLKVFAHHREQRLQNQEALEQVDIVVTSYSTMTRDVELLDGFEFNLILADEAQHIKNRRTQAARTLRLLQAKGRFMLTGTPVENSVDDLRSLFDFIMPGYLSRMPDGVRGEEKAWFDQRHLSQAAPYILRRNKASVAPELPEKMEQTIYCDLTSAQQRLYQDIRQKTEQDLLSMEVAGASAGKLRFSVLAQLLRLRQVCSEPRLIREQLQAADSTKLAVLEEILNEAEDDGHRILLFSQFTSVLAYLRKWLEERGTRYCYLDGKTRNRLQVCDQFNGDDRIPIFLISLKAGGTGLNLTGADTVVHYDPWWNPAAEAQATDRAHRIGQTKKVNVMKLITTGTVEEKVLELQQTKSELLQNLFDESGERTAKVSLEDMKSLLSER